MKEMLDHCNGAVSEKTSQIFSPSLRAKYMYVTAFSGRTDAPEVTCDLTERQTDPTTVTIAAHCAARVNNSMHRAMAGLRHWVFSYRAVGEAKQ